MANRGMQANDGQFSNQKTEMSEIEREEQAACPNCKYGERSLYRLENGQVIFACQECDAIWATPNQIGWGETTSCTTLERMFSVSDAKTLFEGNANWVKPGETLPIEWQNLLKNNPLLLKRY